MREQDRARSFGRAVDAYDRARPGYPAEALERIIEAASTRLRRPVVDAVDVGAGTGKLTRDLAARIRRVHAVEPDSAMRERLHANLPSVEVWDGTAESIPLGDAEGDLVTMAQAWHWVDPVAASAEVARVLRPSGSLALIWNVRDVSVDWVRDLGELMSGDPRVDEDESRRPRIVAPLLRYDAFEVPWEAELDRDALVDLVFSRSYVIALDDDERTRLRERLDAFVAATPELAGTSIRLPYVTRVTLAAAE